MKTLHGGPKTTLSTIRHKFWIIGGVRTVKTQIRQCVTCQRHKQQTSQHIRANLPQHHVTPTCLFTNIGVVLRGKLFYANKTERSERNSHYERIRRYVCMPGGKICALGVGITFKLHSFTADSRNYK